MLSDVKNVVSTLFTGKHAPAKPSDPSMPANMEKPTEAPAALPQSNTEEENGAAHIGVPIRGISSRGSGQGVIYTSVDGRISMHSSPTSEVPPHVIPPASPRERLSRLWSKSRRSTDGSVPKPAEPQPSEVVQPSEPAIEAPVEPGSHSAPSSPTAKHTRVPLKDKVMGTLEFIGKIGYGL
ncbi:hypothetical protein B0J17DRAFT_675804 [Rhizoctonia solani]|nr:hypothetical protein B0J17DRAFT_675804 [Rhizoctonia solani]